MSEIKPVALWSMGGDFRIVDADDDDAPLAELKLYSPLREMAIDKPQSVAKTILEALAKMPHPFADEELEDE